MLFFENAYYFVVLLLNLNLNINTKKVIKLFVHIA